MCWYGDLSDDEAHASLQRRAAAAGQSLQQYLAAELTRLASTPTMADVLARISSTRGSGRLDRAVAGLDEERRPR